MIPTDDLRIRGSRRLASPSEVISEYPLTGNHSAIVAGGRRAIEAILRGQDSRLLVIVGPCSVHDCDAAVEYARRLKPEMEKYADDLLIVMRVYFEKPRTIIGWKGLINDPHLDGSFDINTGLRIARKLLRDIVSTGIPVGTEFLDTVFGQYYADLISWGAIGARTTESQIHRELASGLSMPVGFKNRTDGDLQVAIDAIRAAAHPHWFPSLTKEGTPAILETSGNPYGHLVLRGGTRSGPNFSKSHIDDVEKRLSEAKLNPRVIVDCSHGNSNKDHRNQPAVARDLCAQIADGTRTIAGVMIESHLVGGRQELTSGSVLLYGQSITDACLGWDETLPLLEALGEAAKKRVSVSKSLPA